MEEGGEEGGEEGALRRPEHVENPSCGKLSEVSLGRSNQKSQF